MQIQAEVVTIDEGPPVVIGFADNDNLPVNYLLLQYDPAEQDGLYIETNDQQRSGYNLVQRVQLAADVATIELTPTGAQVLKVGSRITITISSRIKGWASLKTKLVQLLGRVVPVEV